MVVCREVRRADRGRRTYATKSTKLGCAAVIRFDDFYGKGQPAVIHFGGFSSEGATSGPTPNGRLPQNPPSRAARASLCHKSQQTGHRPAGLLLGIQAKRTISGPIPDGRLPQKPPSRREQASLRHKIHQTGWEQVSARCENTGKGAFVPDDIVMQPQTRFLLEPIFILCGLYFPHQDLPTNSHIKQ